MLKKHEVDAEEERLRQLASELPEQAKIAFYQQLKSRLKDPDTYAVLNWCFLAGFHHFYLGYWLHGLLNLAVSAVGIGLLFTPVWWAGAALLVLLALFELADLFRSQIIVQHYNNQLMQKLLNDDGDPM